MSLEHVAAHLAAKGRGPDETLVHMSGKELAGLQTLANMHGGSLTSNPSTGLPEAGFLDNILPALIGGAAMYFTGGAAAPWIEGLTNAQVIGGGIGALETARTGDLGKGLMAGLGAYGGAGLASGLGSAFGSEAAANAANANVAGATANEAGREMLSAGPWGTAAETPVASSLGTTGIMKYGAAAAAPAIIGAMQPQTQAPQGTQQMIRPYTFAANKQIPANMVSTQYQPGQDTSERMWFQPQYTALTPYKAAEGGLLDLGSMAAGGGPVEQMSNNAAIGANTMYPMANMTTSAFSTPYQDPRSTNMIAPSGGAMVNSTTGELTPQGTRLAQGGLSSLADVVTGENVMPMGQEKRMAAGGISTLGGYSDGGRMLKGPGDGMSDDIPAMIGNKQPARLADGEFVVPADVVSHLGNGSTDAGAKQLYHMMDRIRQQRTGKKKQAPQINPAKAMPA